MSIQPAPPISKELIDWLHEIYPHRIPNPISDDTRQVWFDAGVQHVVRRLESKQAKQGGHNKE